MTKASKEDFVTWLTISCHLTCMCTTHHEVQEMFLNKSSEYLGLVEKLNSLLPVSSCKNLTIQHYWERFMLLSGQHRNIFLGALVMAKVPECS